MKRIIFSILPLLFIFISCDPFPGTLDGYTIDFSDSNISKGYIDINISGSLPAKHRNPVLRIDMDKDFESISIESYELDGDTKYLTHKADYERNVYRVWLGGGEIDYIIRVKMQEHGNYEICCQILADRTDAYNFDYYSKHFEFTY